MSAAVATRARPHTDVAILAERLDGHDRRDDERFGALNTSLDEVKADVKTLTGKVTEIAEDVGVIKGRISAPPPPPPPPPPKPSRWHIGSMAWTIISAALGVLMAITAWLAIQVYDLQPARIAYQVAHPHQIATPTNAAVP